MPLVFEGDAVKREGGSGWRQAWTDLDLSHSMVPADLVEPRPSLDAATLKENPNALPTLRMCTAPPLAVDRLIGLASANKSLIGSMQEGKLAARMKAELLEENLTKVCRILTKLLDRDIFPWLDAGKEPTDHERDRASTIVADRLCSAVANPIASPTGRVPSGPVNWPSV